jgi:hypothetical protein
MQPAMRPSETALFKSVIRCSGRYVEFGCGGTTVLAHSMGCPSIITIDSSLEWLEKVKNACIPNERTRIKTIHVNIGPLKELGYPKDDKGTSLWETYHSSPWDDPDVAMADTYLIDGRFRVACAVQTALRCSKSAVIMIHDFANRPNYHCVRQVLREIVCTDDLSVFQLRSDFTHLKATALLAQHAQDPV